MSSKSNCRSAAERGCRNKSQVLGATSPRSSREEWVLFSRPTQNCLRLHPNFAGCDAEAPSASGAQRAPTPQSGSRVRTFREEDSPGTPRSLLPPAPDTHSNFGPGRRRAPKLNKRPPGSPGRCEGSLGERGVTAPTPGSRARPPAAAAVASQPRAAALGPQFRGRRPLSPSRTGRRAWPGRCRRGAGTGQPP